MKVTPKFREAMKTSGELHILRFELTRLQEANASLRSDLEKAKEALKAIDFNLGQSGHYPKNSILREGITQLLSELENSK